MLTWPTTRYEGDHKPLGWLHLCPERERPLRRNVRCGCAHSKVSHSIIIDAAASLSQLQLRTEKILQCLRRACVGQRPGWRARQGINCIRESLCPHSRLRVHHLQFLFTKEVNSRERMPRNSPRKIDVSLGLLAPEQSVSLLVQYRAGRSDGVGLQAVKEHGHWSAAPSLWQFHCLVHHAAFLTIV